MGGQSPRSRCSRACPPPAGAAAGRPASRASSDRQPAPGRRAAAGDLQLASVHVLAGGRAQPRRRPSNIPIAAAGEQRHPGTGGVGLLHHVGEHIVATMPVDDGQPVNAGDAQRLGNVGHDRDQGWAQTLTVPAKPLCSWEQDSVTGASWWSGRPDLNRRPPAPKLAHSERLAKLCFCRSSSSGTRNIRVSWNAAARTAHQCRSGLAPYGCSTPT
jgi:hypothetical protein